MTFTHLSIEQLKTLLDEHTVTLLDIRDETSFQAGHIDGSIPLDDHGITKFVDQTEKASKVVVVCYHGHSSQNAASFLVDQGFSEVYSLDGGYTAWIDSNHH